MKTYKNFNEMFNDNHNTSKNINIFNEVEEYDNCFDVGNLDMSGSMYDPYRWTYELVVLYAPIDEEDEEYPVFDGKRYTLIEKHWDWDTAENMSSVVDEALQEIQRQIPFSCEKSGPWLYSKERGFTREEAKEIAEKLDKLIQEKDYARYGKYQEEEEKRWLKEQENGGLW